MTSQFYLVHCPIIGHHKEETLKIALNDVLVYYSLYLKENQYYCEMCSREISKGDHNFSDICGNCLENEVDL